MALRREILDFHELQRFRLLVCQVRLFCGEIWGKIPVKESKVTHIHVQSSSFQTGYRLMKEDYQLPVPHGKQTVCPLDFENEVK